MSTWVYVLLTESMVQAAATLTSPGNLINRQNLSSCVYSYTRAYTSQPMTHVPTPTPTSIPNILNHNPIFVVFFFISMRNINIFFYFIRMIVTMKSGIRSFEYYITEGHMLYIFPYICIQKHFSSCPSQIVNINAKRVTFKLQSYKVKIWPNCLKRLCWLHPLEEYFLEKDMQPP